MERPKPKGKAKAGPSTCKPSRGYREHIKEILETDQLLVDIWIEEELDQWQDAKLVESQEE